MAAKRIRQTCAAVSVLCIVSYLLVTSSASPARADVLIAVTTTADTIDPGDGLTSFREAIDLANTAAAPVTIVLSSATYPLTHCTPGEGEPSVNRSGGLDLTTSQPVTIHGNSATVDQTCSSLILRTYSSPFAGGFVSLDHLTARHGHGYGAAALYLTHGANLDHVSVTDAHAVSGQAVAVGIVTGSTPTALTDVDIVGTTNGGALAIDLGGPPDETVPLTRVHVTDNSVTAPGGFDDSAGLSTRVSVTLIDSEVARNAGSMGAPVQGSRRVELVRSTVHDNNVAPANTAGLAGGVQAVEARLTDSSVSGNVGNAAGGIRASHVELTRSVVAANTGYFFGGLMLTTGTIEDSSIVDNTAAAAGGVGVFGVSGSTTPRPEDTLRFVNTTVSGNQGRAVGGILVDTTKQANQALPVITIDRSTVAGNRGLDPDSKDELSYQHVPGETPQLLGTLQLTQSVMGEGASTRPACAFDGSTVVSVDHNVGADSSCGIGAGPGDASGVGDVKLGSLSAFGSSPLPVRVPLPVSILRNRIPTGVTGCPGTDERGRARPQQGRCDVGAVEAAGGGYHPLDTPQRAYDSRDHTKLGPGEKRAIPLAPAFGEPWQAAVVNVTITDVTAPTHLTLWGGLDPNKPTVSNLNAHAGQTIANHVVVPMEPNAIQVFNNAGSADVIIDVEGYFDNGDSVPNSLDVCPCGDALVTLPAPARALDTRPGSPFGPGEQRTLHLAGTNGIPTDATAVVLNTTITDATTASHLTLWPNGQPTPTVSNLNWPAGDTIANAAFTGLGTNGDIEIRNNTGNVNVIVDVVGWFRTQPDGNRYTSVRPTRILDTRDGHNPWTAGEQRTVAATPGAIPDDAPIIIANLTGVTPTTDTHLTGWPTGAPLPASSTLNLRKNDTRPNLMVTGLGNSQFTIRNNTGTIDILADIQGWFG